MFMTNSNDKSWELLGQERPRLNWPAERSTVVPKGRATGAARP
jgi:hypothetical protein